MRAVEFRAFGDLDQLSLVTRPDPAAPAGWVAIRVVAASVNQSDVKNLEGAMEDTTLPRTPGRDFSGVVEQGPAEWIGAEVWGTGGDIGFTLDGSHAETLLVPAGALARKPAALTHVEAGSVGVTFSVGWLGLDYAALKAGETLVVVGIAGGVGGAVAQIAAAIGARVIGVDLDPPAPEAPAHSRISDFLKSDDPKLRDQVLDLTGGRGADVVFDAVGGVMFEPSLRLLARRGRLIEISATGRRRVEFDLADFYHNEGRILGADSRKLTVVDSAAIMRSLAARFEDGRYDAPIIARTFPLEQAVEAYEAVKAGAQGRVVLQP
jgi:NADPH:quinone reductase-like Zn-dependent oxidoreductase